MAPSARRIIVAVAAGISLVAGSLATAPPQTQAATSTEPMTFGMFAGNTKTSSVQALESTVGRSYAYIRVYRSWDDAFPDTDVNWMRSTGHSLFLSIKARNKNGTNVSWQAIADAQPGSALYADTSNSQRSGTPTEFIAAWRKWVSVMKSESVTNARFSYTTAILNYSVSPTSKKYAPKYYPGDAWVDDIAVDAYNMYCKKKNGTFANPWRSLATLLAPFMAFVADHPGIPLVLAEFGSPEDPNAPGRKAQWIADAQQMFKQPAYQRFIAISYWNTVSHNYDDCDFRITTSASAVNAFQTMASDPFYSGAVT
jgi:hypothetical protein